MANTVLNLSRNCHIKHNQAASRIAAGTAEWVETGRSIRELTLAEVLKNRAAQVQLRQLADSVELPGIKYEPPASDKYKNRWPLVSAANLLMRHSATNTVQ